MPASRVTLAYELETEAAPASTKFLPRVLTVGSSTGGPQALFDVFSKLGRANSSCRCSSPSTCRPRSQSILAETPLKSKRPPGQGRRERRGREARDDLCRPGGKHMVVDKVGDTVKYVSSSMTARRRTFVNRRWTRCSARLPEAYGGRMCCRLILTGMGHDGRDGVKDMLEAGGGLIAQDQTTSVVWGMPGAVAEAGLCSAVLPLGRIGQDRCCVLPPGEER